MDVDERALLGDWAAAFAGVFGWAPAIQPLEGDPGAGLTTCTFRPDFRPPDLLGNAGFFRERPRLAAYVARLGYGWDADGRIVTTPSPATFNVLRDRYGPPAAGYPVRYVVADRAALPLAPWLRMYLDGELPIHVATAGFYARHAAAAAAGRVARDALTFHFAAFAHDLTVHALNYSAVPRDAAAALCAAVRAAVPDRYAAWTAPAAVAPLTLTTFLDRDLNHYCYAVWARCEDVADFAPTFRAPRHLDQLWAALALRLAETAAGRGDVPSGDTRDLPPLARVAFDLG